MKRKDIATAAVPAPGLIGFDEVAGMLGLKAKTLRNQLSARRLGFPAVKLGRAVRFERGDVLKFIARCKEQAA